MIINFIHKTEDSEVSISAQEALDLIDKKTDHYLDATVRTEHYRDTRVSPEEDSVLVVTICDL